jgi:MFS family permease
LSAFTAITAGIGPVMGGWLVEHISWRAIFFINVPLAFAVLAIAILRVPESRENGASKSLDWLDAGLPLWDWERSSTA